MLKEYPPVRGLFPNLGEECGAMVPFAQNETVDPRPKSPKEFALGARP